MDYDKFYLKKNNGTYGLHFANNQGLSIAEVKEMFSAYGNVVSVDFGKGDRGFCFVQVKNVHDVISCLKGFQNHSSIKILPQKSKLNSNGNNSNNGDSNKGKIQNLFKTNVKKSEYMSSVSESNSVSSHEPLHYKDDIPDLIEPSLEDDFLEHEVQFKTTVIIAQEVIVANIDENYGIHYILHLFEKHNPISISLMRQCPKSNLRYCHVYFETSEDARAVEEKFDNFLLSKRNLIVLRLQELIEKTL